MPRQKKKYSIVLTKAALALSRKRPSLLRRLSVKRHTFTSGVYFLCLRDDIVYVGKSVNLSSRISGGHTEKAYNRVYFIPCKESELFDIERFFIAVLRPTLNKFGKDDTTYAAGRLYLSSALVSRCLNISVAESKSLAYAKLGDAYYAYNRDTLFDYLAGIAAPLVVAA